MTLVPGRRRPWRRFSRRGDLAADGVVGPQTWPQLIIQVQQGSDGDAVRAVQSQIHGRGDGATIAVDGIFGSDTDDAVRAFQTLLGLSVDGVVGEQTWNHLVNGYLAAPDPQTAAKDVFAAWEAHDRDQAGKNATPGAVTEIFTHSFTSGDGWSFQAAGPPSAHVLHLETPHGHELRITVIDAVEGPYYVADRLSSPERARPAQARKLRRGGHVRRADECRGPYQDALAKLWLGRASGGTSRVQAHESRRWKSCRSTSQTPGVRDL